jgi:hypothetical protein
MKTTILNFKLTSAVMWFAIMIFAVSSAQAATITVANFNDSGPGSLRDAITQANNIPGADIITFTSGGTINLVTPLPAITDPVTIDAGTEPRVELNGAATQNADNESIGFWLRAGDSTIQGFIINRFGEAGIRMDSDTPNDLTDDNGNTIRANRIGTNAAGDSTSCGTASASCGNINRGILIVGTTGHAIGVSVAGGGNLISGNQGRGIEITAGGSATVRNNLIGTNAGGTGDLGNLSHGVFIVNSSNSLIGGTAAEGADRNVISGNNGHGIAIVGDIGTPASNNSVFGNFIGVNASGNTALMNSASGILIQSSNNQIGGNSAEARNVISGNFVNGISISTTLATGNFVAGNLIGVGADGTTAIGNADNGIQISSQASNNVVGGVVGAGDCAVTAQCSIIANNGTGNSLGAKAGIYLDITAGVGNSLRRNSIFNNFGLGIDLGAVGVTANDTGDPDMGPNNLQNYPVVSSAEDNGTVTGTLNSTANTTFAIDFYRNLVSDSAGSEGRTYIGSTQVTTNGSGDATFSFSASSALTVGQLVTATATALSGAAQAVGDTSEFSSGVTVSATGTVSISGRVTYGTTPANQSTKPVPNVVVTARTSGGETAATDTTDASGFYQLNNLTPGTTYTVTPTKSGEVNGITPFDATLVLRHVAANGQGANALNSNQQAAADTNNSGDITPFDATLILRYVATNGPGANTGAVGTWEFIPPSRMYDPLLTSQTNQDYTAILLGEVNGDWMPSAPPNSVSFETEKWGKQPSKADDSDVAQSGVRVSPPMNLSSGQSDTVLVPVMFSSRNSKSISGYAVDATFDPNALELDSANPVNTAGSLTSDSFTIHTDTATPGRIGIAAAGSSPALIADGVLIKLRFKVIGSAKSAKGKSVISVSRAQFDDSDGKAVGTAIN